VPETQSTGNSQKIIREEAEGIISKSPDIESSENSAGNETSFEAGISSASPPRPQRIHQNLQLTQDCSL
jgi:hypothetical protein